MQHEKNIQRLKQQLTALGFKDGLEKLLRYNICFLPAAFEMPFATRISGDDVSYRLQIERDNTGEYIAGYYDAAFRKRIDVKEASGEIDIDIEGLENRMAGVDWDDVAAHTDGIEGIVTELERLAAIGAEGIRVASLLKFKYWAGTCAEAMVPGISALKSQYEISQRFYITEGRGITTEEAYRFLCSKWVEKKMAVKKKQETKHGRI